MGGGCMSITAMKMLRRGKLVTASAHNLCTGCRISAPFNQTVEESDGLLDLEAYGPLEARVQVYYGKNKYYEPSVAHLRQRILEVWQSPDSTLERTSMRARNRVNHSFDRHLVALELGQRLDS